MIRLINNYQASQEAEITVGSATQKLVFGKYEVKTLFYDGALHQLDTMEIQKSHPMLIGTTIAGIVYKHV